jgi:hypothetical protein
MKWGAGSHERRGGGQWWLERGARVRGRFAEPVRVEHAVI